MLKAEQNIVLVCLHQGVHASAIAMQHTTVSMTHPTLTGRVGHTKRRRDRPPVVNTENYRKIPKTTENLPKTTEINRNQLKIGTGLLWGYGLLRRGYILLCHTKVINRHVTETEDMLLLFRQLHNAYP